MSTRELEDFEPTTGHLHGCEMTRDCSCLADLYAVAAFSDEDRAAAEARVADLEAGIRRLADEAKPGLSKMCTCPDCEDDESPIWHDGTPIAWTLDPAHLRALVGDETPGTGEGA